MAASFLSCRPCITRTARVAARSSTAETASRITPATAHLCRPSRGRRFVTDVPATEKPDDALERLQPSEQDVAVAQRKQREKLQRTVKKHLAYMDDPWKIAKHVEQTLLKDRFDEALLLTQQCSQNGQVVVAWNHLIGYQLEKQQLKQAISLFNEMKKRSQLPNVQTFTILFRGCAKSQHPKTAVAEAIKHYNLLMADKRLHPNSTHLNAVLNVCARAGDLDSMFLIANTANDSTRAPTAYTYTIILNALRYDAIKDVRHLSPEQHAANVQRAIDRSKGLWVEVMEKWKQGRILVDEELVCAMGRILLLEPKREDKRAVLDLLHQTMNIPNLAKQSVEKEKQLSQDAKDTPQNVTTVPSKDKDNTEKPPSEVTSPVPTSSKALYAVPGRNTLALVLTALASARLTTSGIKYWNLLVRQHGIVPDMDNWLRLFGLLKVAKASAHAASALDMVPDEYVSAKPYQIAMQTCIRDNINPNTVANATAIFQSMVNRFPVPDVHVCRLFLRVALVSHYQLRQRAQDGDEEGARQDYGKQITGALDLLWDPYKRLHYHYFKVQPPTVAPDDHKARAILYNDQREVVAFARLMYSSFNKVLNESMLPEWELRRMRPVAAKINREIQKFFANREQIEPNLRRAAKEVRLEAQAVGVSDEIEHESAIEDVSDRQGGDFIWNTQKSGEPVSSRRRGR